MTFKGDMIIGKPTFAMIESFIAEKGLFCEPKDVFNILGKQRLAHKERN